MSIKKVYLVTRRAGYNFGSSLQAYALQNIFLERGCDCEILNVQEMRMRGKMRLFLLDTIGKIFQVLPFLKCFVSKKRFEFLVQSYQQRRKFDEFNTKTLIVSKSKLYSDKKLQEYVGSDNLIVCGSDQIWNPLGFSPTMFLSFADPAFNTLAAYAPSFGLSSLPSHKEEISKLVNRFHFLSVREKAGVDILSNLTDKDVALILDPTLVVNHTIWKKLEIPIQVSSKKYILCYFLSTDMYPLQFINELSKQYNLEVINIQTNYNAYYMEGAINKADLGPGNFLYLLSHAEFICTNSFHCSIFSHLYNKDFFVFNRFAQEDKANQNSRIETLLEILGKKDKMRDVYAVNWDNLKNHIHTTSSLEKYYNIITEKYIEKICSSLKP